jgi:hypothetical protein
MLADARGCGKMIRSLVQVVLKGQTSTNGGSIPIGLLQRKLKEVMFYVHNRWTRKGLMRWESGESEEISRIRQAVDSP